MSPEKFFEQLVKKTEEAFKQSPVGQKHKLAYSISATPLRIGKPLILGINWGGSGPGFKSQVTMPTPEDLTADIIRTDYKFLERTRTYFEKYKHLELNPDEPNFNYSNLCFFRSRTEHDLTLKDYENSYPLVKELIEYLNPKFILALGVTVYQRINKLSEKGQLEVKEIVDSENKHRGFKGKFLGFNFYCLPHPNARVKSASRDEIWKKVFA